LAETYDLVIIGAGSGGLTAAGFAAQLGAKTALIEKSRIGGDCTWTGCVPSKALLKAAKVAHEARTAARYGVAVSPPTVDMAGVRAYVQRAIQEVYQFETPDALRHEGVEPILAPARFLDPHTVGAGDRIISAKYFLIATGARPAMPDISGIEASSFCTYERIFDNDRLPARLTVIGGGPIGLEIAQAYQRLGAQTTLVAPHLLPKEEPEVQEVLAQVFAREGMNWLRGRASAIRRRGDAVVVETPNGEAEGDLLFVASGRKPTVAGLDLEKAGVRFTEDGIPVDQTLRTNVKHIFAAGDVLGGHQFTHFAGWQAFQAVRNALLVGSASGFSEVVPWVTFTDPEVAHVGLTEAHATEKFPGQVKTFRWELTRADRAVCDGDTDGFIKLVCKPDGALLGATVVAARAGEVITEFVVALKNNLAISDLANAIHAYPTYSTAVQQLASAIAIENFLSGTAGKVVRGLSKIMR
jgi:pyruvate/2-oxoglutarate dehydrogenase complex dihydrolipoamide dehydrogenase (E3) component